ncbi:protein RIC-3b [Oncorhynchus mykiss]|uniref:Resistance to inhibitors of cholinesterase protein 3 N-terminal domain-containing protein n=1 Tax=Oncorhynchus mykiss TaxID=8022 RepID=A0A8K9VF14_ONCMY|nr:protein RIC-3b [Oncorhynchus mykiss]
MSMSTFQKVTLVSCLVLCVALLLPKMLLGGGKGAQTEGSGRFPPMVHRQMAPDSQGQSAAGSTRAHNTEAIARAKGGGGTGVGTGGKSNLAGQIIPIYGFAILLYILYILFKITSKGKCAVPSEPRFPSVRAENRKRKITDFELTQLQDKLRETEMVMERIVSKASYSPERVTGVSADQEERLLLQLREITRVMQEGRLVEGVAPTEMGAQHWEGFPEDPHPCWEEPFCGYDHTQATSTEEQPERTDECGADQEGVAYQEKGGAYQKESGAYQKEGGAYQKEGGADQEEGVANKESGVDQEEGRADQKDVGLNQEESVVDQEVVGVDQDEGRADQKDIGLNQEESVVDQVVVGVDQEEGRADQKDIGLNQEESVVDQEVVGIDQEEGRADQKEGGLDQEESVVDQEVVRVDQEEGRADQEEGAAEDDVGVAKAGADLNTDEEGCADLATGNEECGAKRDVGGTEVEKAGMDREEGGANDKLGLADEDRGGAEEELEFTLKMPTMLEREEKDGVNLSTEMSTSRSRVRRKRNKKQKK